MRLLRHMAAKLPRPNLWRHPPAPLPYQEIPCVESPNTLNPLTERGYLDANPEVLRAGYTAAEHFTRWGQFEGRIQLCNYAQVAALRDLKLPRIRFRRAPHTPRQPGEPANFLSPATIATFAIPEEPPVSANPYGAQLWDDIRANPHKLYLDLGAGLRQSVCSNVINTEIYPSISTDVLCVGEDMPFASNQFDFVFCGAVLEHTRRPWDVAKEICRVLKPGGTVLVDYPFLQGVHGYPHHYFNATPQGVISLFEADCTILSSSIEPNNHPIQALWWLLATWRDGLAPAERGQFLSMSVADILATPPSEQLEAPFCAGLSDRAQRMIPAGSTLWATKQSR